MAWSGCIDNPAEGLCTPDNIEEKCAQEIQFIRDKWKVAKPPAEFGAEPKPVSRTTKVLKKNWNPWGNPFTVDVDDTIPGGYSYDGGSASLYANANVLVQSTQIQSQPGNGATGGIQFTGKIDTKPTRKEITYYVTYVILSDAAKAWQDQVSHWRNEQAQKEIDILISKKLEELTQWELSDRVANVIEQKIFENYFGVTSIEDCCRFIARVRSLFDFGNLSYSLLPSWNDVGDPCQSADPVSFLTARCLSFYLPMHEGRELEALILLASIGAIPWSADIRSQIIGYVNEVSNARATLFNRLFDPTGMEPNIDGPNGISFTAYDTDETTDWNHLCESDLNFVLIDKHNFTIPTGSTRIEARPNLC